MEVAQLPQRRSILDAIEEPAPAPAARPSADDRHRTQFVESAVRRILAGDLEFERYRSSSSLVQQDGLLDYLIAAEDEPHSPDEVFGRIRWGGQFVYLTRHPEKLDKLDQQFGSRGFRVLRGPAITRTGPLRFLPFLGRKVHYLIARKMYLTKPREITERFTYHVQLVEPRQGMAADAVNGCVVRKEVPSLERVIGRLRAKFSDVPQNVIERRARKFTEKIFPLFLTREAAMLKILQRDLPPQYARRVPTLLEAEKDSRGYVTRMWINWLRNGGRQLSHLEFARQSADLLRVIHNLSNIIHLDLRLDNMVITEHGVGFVDFGSAVRVGENIHGNPMLSGLFEELMRTSQIQRMLDQMRNTGSLTSYIMCDAYGKVDKAVDLFYLAVQIKQPSGNPDIANFIKYDKDGPEAAALTRLMDQVLRPPDPHRPLFRSAADVLEGLNRVEDQLKGKATPRVTIEKYG
ncbi:MAG TPA: hypothetical protein VH370_14930 [Humisphaera sp.]|jgi:hypothetical protein|nr:hypothetical protein [Humisphaera sp.]